MSSVSATIQLPQYNICRVINLDTPYIIGADCGRLIHHYSFESLN